MLKSFQFLNQTLVFRIFGQPFGSQTLIAVSDEPIVLAISGRKQSHCCLSESLIVILDCVAVWYKWPYCCSAWFSCSVKVSSGNYKMPFFYLLKDFKKERKGERESCEGKETINMTWCPVLVQPKPNLCGLYSHWFIERTFEKASLLVISQFTLYKIGLDNVNSINDCTESLSQCAVKTVAQPLIIYGFNDCNFEEC